MHSKKAQGLVFHKGPVNKIPVFLKCGPGSGLGVQKVSENCVIPDVKVQDYYFCVCNLPVENNKQINKLIYDCL